MCGTSCGEERFALLGHMSWSYRRDGLRRLPIDEAGVGTPTSKRFDEGAVSLFTADQVGLGQSGERLTDCWSADVQMVGDFVFGWKLLIGFEFAAFDQLTDLNLEPVIGRNR